MTLLCNIAHNTDLIQYHSIDFNCNSFTNDLVGFLTGGSIPDFIKGMPVEGYYDCHLIFLYLQISQQTSCQHLLVLLSGLPLTICTVGLCQALHPRVNSHPKHQIQIWRRPSCKQWLPVRPQEADNLRLTFLHQHPPVPQHPVQCQQHRQ